MTRLSIALVLCLITSLSVAGGYPSLWESSDAQLQKQLEDMIRDNDLKPAVDAGELALALVDISILNKPRVASLNGDQMFYAASLPKIAILLGAFVLIEDGELVPDERLKRDMNRMIRQSDNSAATRVLEHVGRDRLLEILQSQKYLLYDMKHNGGLWVGKDYGPSNAYRRDPLNKLSHGATAMQVARFYYLLDTNRLVGPEWTKTMKQMLSEPAINHKFVKGLKDIEGTRIYRKSGTWKHYHADSALVEFSNHKYIIVGLAKGSQGGKWMEFLAKPLHDILTGAK